MTVAQFLAMVAESKQHKFLYHFTDTRNLPSIRQHGLLSTSKLKELGVTVPAPGGNEWSLQQDERLGLDVYVHLCFFSEHPMEYVHRQSGHVQQTRFLRINPDVMSQAGVLITDAVANKVGVVPQSPEVALQTLDLEVIYERTDWRVPEIRDRLKLAKVYEVLIPDRVEPKHIGNLDG